MYFLTDKIKQYVILNSEKIYELRLRRDKPVIANIGGVFEVAKYKGNILIATQEDIKKILYNACENSMYIYNDCIKNGYVTTESGVRIGIGGRCVYNDNKMLTISDFNSLCIRFPHQIIDCAEQIYKKIVSNQSIGSLLIISPPGVGKTTAVRDLARLISNNLAKNILIVDEKYEIYSEKYDLGSTCDVLSGCSKKFGFYNGIKNLSPDLIIVDELCSMLDADGVEFATLSGVKVIATAHAQNYSQAVNKDYLSRLLTKKCFDYCITLAKKEGGFYITEVININD